MSIYGYSIMAGFESSSTNDPCQVSIIGPGIVLTYKSDEGREITYKGLEIAPGHYELQCVEVKGKAWLHKVPSSNMLHGWYAHLGEEGMVKIQLEEYD